MELTYTYVDFGSQFPVGKGRKGALLDRKISDKRGGGGERRGEEFFCPIIFDGVA